MSQNKPATTEGTMRTTVNLPDSLWETAKKHCVDERITLKELLALTVREYLTRHATQEVGLKDKP